MVSKRHNIVNGLYRGVISLLLVIGLLFPLKIFATPQAAHSATSASSTYQVPAYERKPGVAGKISSVGSDTLANLMTF